MTRLACGLALLVALGCGDDDSSTEFDAGGVDASGGEDTGGGVDAGGGEDTGGGVDAGGGVDSGGGVDAGPEEDGGTFLRDSGMPFGDAGELGDPEWVPIDVVDPGECVFAACGGDVVGTWDVTGGCIEVETPSELDRCPGATIEYRGRARGRVVFTDTTVDRVGQSEVEAEVFVPAICAMFAGGCSGIEDAVAGAGAEASCVEDASGNCDCIAFSSFVIDDMDTYTIEGNEIVGAGGKRFEYCIEDGGPFTYRDTSPSGTREPGQVELGAR